MDFLSKWIAQRSTRRLSRAFRPNVEHLEARQLLSSTPVTPPGDLRDAQVAPLAQAEYIQSQGQLTRADVIHLFNVVDGTEQAVFTNGQVGFTPATLDSKATLTSSQLTDLHTLVQDAGSWGLTPNVTNLAGKVLNDTPANKKYLPAGQSQLTPGTADSVMQVMVGNWFYGDDLPKINVKGATYRQVNGTLFGKDGPKASDVAQGAVADCYFLSMLAETAMHSPQTVKNMFIDNHDGTWTVCFYNRGVADYVTVNRELPANSKGEFVYANHDFDGHTAKVSNSKNVLWVALAEKAYAQLAAEGWSISASSTDAYASIRGSQQNSLAAGKQITGWNAGNWIGSTSLNTAVLTQIVNDFKDGGLITFCLHGNHYYYMTGYDAATGKFTFANEYQVTATKTLKLTFSQLKKSSGSWFCEVLPPQGSS